MRSGLAWHPLHELSSFAIPSHVAGQTNRLVKNMLFIVVILQSIGISSLHDIIGSGNVEVGK